MSTDLTKHPSGLAVFIRECQDRAAASQILVELVGTLVWLLLGQQQEQIRFRDVSFHGFVGKPVVDAHDVGKPQGRNFLLHGHGSDRTTCADEVDAQLLGSYVLLAAEGGETSQKQPRVASIVERASVGDTHGSWAS